MTSRTTFSAPHIASLLLAAILLPGAKADCFINISGFERCDGLSVGARVGIAVGIFIVVLALSLSFGYLRRRRIQQANLAFINQPQYNNNNNNNNSYNYQQSNFQAGYVPQYPPQTPYGEQSPYHGYDNGQPFAPPPGTPPQAHVADSPAPPDYYAPPAGPPPNSGMNKRPMQA